MVFGLKIIILQEATCTSCILCQTCMLHSSFRTSCLNMNVLFLRNRVKSELCYTICTFSCTPMYRKIKACHLGEYVEQNMKVNLHGDLDLTINLYRKLNSCHLVCTLSWRQEPNHVVLSLYFAAAVRRNKKLYVIAKMMRGSMRGTILRGIVVGQ